MSDTTADEHRQDEPQPESDGGGSNFWPDETVDVLCGLVVFTCLTLGVLWYVVNG